MDANSQAGIQADDGRADGLVVLSFEDAERIQNEDLMTKLDAEKADDDDEKADDDDPDTQANGFPSSIDGEQDCVLQLSDAIKSIDEALDYKRAPKKDVEGTQTAGNGEDEISLSQAMDFLNSRTDEEVQVISWKVLYATKDAYEGKYSMPAWASKDLKPANFGSFRARLDSVLEALRLSKMLCKNLFDTQHTFIQRVAMNSTAEIKRKHGNKRLNDIRNQQVKHAILTMTDVQKEKLRGNVGQGKRAPGAGPTADTPATKRPKCQSTPVQPGLPLPVVPACLPSASSSQLPPGEATGSATHQPNPTGLDSGALAIDPVSASANLAHDRVGFESGHSSDQRKHFPRCNSLLQAAWDRIPCCVEMSLLLEMELRSLSLIRKPLAQLLVPKIFHRIISTDIELRVQMVKLSADVDPTTTTQAYPGYNAIDQPAGATNNEGPFDSQQEAFATKPANQGQKHDFSLPGAYPASGQVFLQDNAFNELTMAYAQPVLSEHCDYDPFPIDDQPEYPEDWDTTNIRNTLAVMDAMDAQQAKDSGS
ncbi:hypothetical protein Daus18300_006065 [Diaporthe australafricana]|uniref:Uncharacterized protein n=1 Tax=Diaporthe australafricana TaxID=127596 RepID=A0ABR3WXM0_9PEZI